MKSTNIRFYPDEISELYEIDMQWLERRRLGVYGTKMVCAFSDQVSRLVADGFEEQEARELVFLELF